MHSCAHVLPAEAGVRSLHIGSWSGDGGLAGSSRNCCVQVVMDVAFAFNVALAKLVHEFEVIYFYHNRYIACRDLGSVCWLQDLDRRGCAGWQGKNGHCCHKEQCYDPNAWAI